MQSLRLRLASPYNVTLCFTTKSQKERNNMQANLNHVNKAISLQIELLVLMFHNKTKRLRTSYLVTVSSNSLLQEPDENPTE